MHDAIAKAARDSEAPQLDFRAGVIDANDGHGVSLGTERCTVFSEPFDLVQALVVAIADHDPSAAHCLTTQILIECRDAPRQVLWDGLADEAEYHGVAPLLEPHISAFAKKFPDVIPHDVRRAFLLLASRHRRAAAAREIAIDQLLAAFAEASIPIVFLKGTALAHLIYPAPGLRPAVDIDVLVDASDLPRVVRVVGDLGYSFASGHASRFAGRMHHLPAATRSMAGFLLSLEIHVDALSPDDPGNLTLATLSAPPRPYRRAGGADGLALGHNDMLRHLVRHAFEPTGRIKLKHLHDLWLYQKTFAAEIDWDRMQADFADVSVALGLVSSFFSSAASADGRERIPRGAGMAMLPPSEIARMPFRQACGAVFNPSPWWLHGYYGVPTDQSLLTCRIVRHPFTLLCWLARRLRASLVPPSPFRPETNWFNRTPVWGAP